MTRRDFSSSAEQYRCPRAMVVTVQVPATASCAVPVPSHKYDQIPTTVQATFAVYVPVLGWVTAGVVTAPAGSVTVRVTVVASVGTPFTLNTFVKVASSLTSLKKTVALTSGQPLGVRQRPPDRPRQGLLEGDGWFPPRGADLRRVQGVPVVMPGPGRVVVGPPVPQPLPRRLRDQPGHLEDVGLVAGDVPPVRPVRIRERGRGGFGEDPAEGVGEVPGVQPAPRRRLPRAPAAAAVQGHLITGENRPGGEGDELLR